MNKYYTRACNFYYGSVSKKNIKNKKSLSLHGLKEISFAKIEIINRRKTKVINVKDINKLPINLKNKVIRDLKNIKKKKSFKKLSLSEIPILMGIVNLTPDSFSDGGKYNKKPLAINHINNLISNGAKIIDIGGESTRPGAKDINPIKEWDRIKLVLKMLKKKKMFYFIGYKKKFCNEESI